MTRSGKPWCILAALLLGLGLPACSDDNNNEQKLDGSLVKDLAPKDLGQDAATDAKATLDQSPVQDRSTDANLGNMGQGCTKDSECTGSSATCLIISKTEGAGVCTLACTQDKTTTPLVNEDSCPKGYTCGTITYTSGTSALRCLQHCTPSFTKNPCPSSTKLSCHPSSDRFALPGQAVCRYLACTADKECPVYSATTCVLNTDCATVATDAFCDSGTCARPGKCTPGGICGPHPGVGSKTAAVGSPCKSDLDCPENGACIEESSTYTGAIGTAWRNGYCTVRYCNYPTALKEFACPTGSTCNILYYGGYCFKSCKVTDPKGCRNHTGDKGGDYECYDKTNWTYKSIKVAPEPFCYMAVTTTCDSLGTSTCSSVGDSKNTSNMSCRDRYTGKAKTNAKDPKGICLDDTPSGPFDTTAPDAGVTPDAGSAKDAGASS